MSARVAGAWKMRRQQTSATIDRIFMVIWWALLALLGAGLANWFFGTGDWLPAPDVRETLRTWWWPYGTVALAVLIVARIVVWFLDRQRFDPELLKAASLKRVRDLRVGVGRSGGDILIPGYRADVYQERVID